MASLVTKEIHPNIYKAFKAVMYDIGAAGEGVADFLPKEDYDLHAIDQALAALSEEDFEDLCHGEEADQQAIAHSSPVLMQAHALLEEFWEKVN
jgi:hypothetical protein